MCRQGFKHEMLAALKIRMSIFDYFVAIKTTQQKHSKQINTLQTPNKKEL